MPRLLKMEPKCNFFCTFIGLLNVCQIAFRNDAELDTMLRDRLRWGDPMAHLVKVNSL